MQHHSAWAAFAFPGVGWARACGRASGLDVLKETLVSVVATIEAARFEPVVLPSMREAPQFTPVASVRWQLLQQGVLVLSMPATEPATVDDDNNAVSVSQACQY
jgi:hypothetical protein